MELILGLHKLCDADPHVSQFIINMEEAQKKSVREQLSITNYRITPFATFILSKANVFLCNRPVWDVKPFMEQLCSEWNRFMKPLQLVLKRKTDASSDHPEMFGTADAAEAQRYQGILPDLIHHSQDQRGNVQGIMERLDSHFDNLTAVSNNRH